MTMLEQMARAMCLHDYPHLSPDDLDGYSDPGDEGRRPVHKPRWQWFVGKARAAMQAIANPPDMGDEPNMVAGLWSRRNIEAFAEDALNQWVDEVASART